MGYGPPNNPLIFSDMGSVIMFDTGSMLSHSLSFAFGGIVFYIVAMYHSASVRRSYERMYGTGNAEVNALRDHVSKIEEKHKEILKINKEQEIHYTVWEKSLDVREKMLEAREKAMMEVESDIDSIHAQLTRPVKDHYHTLTANDDETRPT